MLKPLPIYRQLQIRRWNFLETEKFISEVKLSPLSAATSLDVDSAFDLHNSTLSGILDKMILFKTIRIHERPSDPWFERECRTSKCLKKSLEKIYMRTKSENDFAAWPGQYCIVFTGFLHLLLLMPQNHPHHPATLTSIVMVLTQRASKKQ